MSTESVTLETLGTAHDDVNVDPCEIIARYLSTQAVLTPRQAHEHPLYRHVDAHWQNKESKQKKTRMNGSTIM